MHSTDPTFDTLVSGAVDPARTPSAAPQSGRRRAAAEQPADAFDAAATSSFATQPHESQQLDSKLSPRRAARAAREAAAAQALAAGASAPRVAPASTVLTASAEATAPAPAEAPAPPVEPASSVVPAEVATPTAQLFVVAPPASSSAVGESPRARGRRAAQAPLDETLAAPAVPHSGPRRRTRPAEAPTVPTSTLAETTLAGTTLAVAGAATVVVETVVTAPLPIVTEPASGRAAASAVPLPTPSAATAQPASGHALAAAVPLPSPSPTGRRQSYVAAASKADRRRPGAPEDPSRRRRGASPTRAVRSAGVAAARPAKKSFATYARRAAVTTVIAGILATSVLPVLNDVEGSAAYAASTGIRTTPTQTGGQQFDVASTVNDAVAARDGYSATPVTSYENSVIAARLADTNMVYTGPTAAEYLAHPLYSDNPLDRAQVFQVALQYLGTPYVHGGETPAAFDCSGFISFVYAQFGINLPHYVPSQDAIGQTIPQSEAVPGDLVIFNTDDHDGFYAGNGMIMDAPKPGGHISVRPIWDAPHHFVRINP